LLHSEVEVRGPVGSTTQGGRDVHVALASRVACAVVIGVDIDIGILEVVVLRCRLMSSVPVAAVVIVACM
jgi:hypothetical protein